MLSPRDLQPRANGLAFCRATPAQERISGRSEKGQKRQSANRRDHGQRWAGRAERRSASGSCLKHEERPEWARTGRERSWPGAETALGQSPSNAVVVTVSSGVHLARREPAELRQQQRLVGRRKRTFLAKAGPSGAKSSTDPRLAWPDHKPLMKRPAEGALGMVPDFGCNLRQRPS